MLFAESITRYLPLRVARRLKRQTEGAAIGRNCGGTEEGKTRRAKDRGRRTRSYQRGTLVKRPTKRMENLSKEIFWPPDETSLVKEFVSLFARRFIRRTLRSLRAVGNFFPRMNDFRY